jgi:acyl-CoA thioesterase I
MIRSLKAAGAHVVLAGMTLPPNYGADYIKPFEKIFTDLAAQHRLPLIPFCLEGVGGVRELMQQDGLHPTVEGNRRVAENVMKVGGAAVEDGSEIDQGACSIGRRAWPAARRGRRVRTSAQP